MEPVYTGVIANNELEWLHEELVDGIDIAWEEHCNNCSNEYHDQCGPIEQGTVLIGDWLRVNGKYEPDMEGEYAAIVGECYTQVVWSKRVTRVRGFCSPCYPGQADVGKDTRVDKGGILAYDVPRGMYGDMPLNMYGDTP